MRTKVSILLVSICFSGVVLADRPLERAEILQIFESLTSQPKKTWIPSGTILARHEEYRAAKTSDANEITDTINREVQAYLDNPDKIELTDELQEMRVEAIPFNVRYRLCNEYTMSSDVIMRFDGSRFYWEIKVDSRSDSVNRSADLAGNFLTEQFNLNGNERRVFAWNGESYATYFRPVNHAIITDTPSGVNGALTAGVIPWGYGRYSYANLCDADSAAVETEADGQTVIELTVTNDDREETFILEPAKNYAVKRYSASVGEGLFVSHTYDNYELTGGNWCPGNIVLERYDMTELPSRLIARDVWAFTSVSVERPEASSFDVAYESDALIEDFTVGAEPLQYRYSSPESPALSRVDTDELKIQRLMIASAGSRYAQNCATASLKYVCDKLGSSRSFEELGELVCGEGKGTTLLAMRDFARAAGLNAVAVRTGIESLKGLSDYEVILHLPRQNHFVVLGDVDGEYVRLIDLDKNRFYYRQSIERFNSLWEGTALLVAKGSVAAKGNLARIDDGGLERIVGVGCGKRCNTVCSSNAEIPCEAPGGSCGGTHLIFYSRVCCGDASSGTCSSSEMVHRRAEHCTTDPHSGECNGIGDWTSYTIWACV